jgi:hypothetical protein
VQQGAYISGIAHAALIVWALFAGFFMSRGDPLPIDTMDVSVLSVAEFEALTAPPIPDLPQPETPQTVAPEIPDVLPEPQVDVAEPTPQPAEDAPVLVAPETPLIQENQEDPAIDTDTATPPPADRVAPEIAPEQPDTVVEGPETPQQAPSEDATVVVPQEPASAPLEAAPEIVTEAETPQSAAPLTSMRPVARPNFQPAPVPTPEDPPAEEDPIALALAEAVEEPITAPPVPTGPPLSRGEKEALRVAVGICWNTGSLSTEAQQTTVTVFVAMQEDGKPDAGSIRLAGFEGGSEAAAKRAYEAARRAIIRCGARGFDLPREKYSQWREIEMIFNPNEMRNK